MDWPVQGITGKIADYGKAGTTSGVDLYAGGTANTKGSVTTIGTTDSKLYGQGLYLVMLPSAVNVTYLVDLYFGSQLVAANILVDQQNVGTMTYFLPIPVPPGTLVRAAIQSTSGTAHLYVQVFVGGGDFNALSPLGKIETVGAETADTSGIAITPNASAGVYGASVLIGAPAKNWRGFILSLGVQHAPKTAIYYVRLALDSGMANIILPGWFAKALGGGIVFPPVYFPIPIAAGQTIYADCQSNAASGAAIDVVLYGLI